MCGTNKWTDVAALCASLMTGRANEPTFFYEKLHFTQARFQ